ncbi:MAG: hypothetical protein V1899_02965 [Planctomycetota bacterium]
MRISDALRVPESPAPKFLDALCLDESCLILPDVEIPLHNAAFVNRCIERALGYGIRAAIFAGDWFHWGSLAHFFESEKDTDEEIEQIEQHIESFIRPFERIFYIAGNHDRRPQITLDRFIGADKMTRLVIPPKLAAEFERKVKASDYFYCWVGEGEDRWRIVHPKATNTVPANAAKAIATANNCNVAMAHNHLVGMQQTADGRHWGLEIGYCVDTERLAYYMRRDTTRPKMRNGALILHKSRDGFIPELLSDGLTLWGEQWQRGKSKSKSRR